MYSTFREVDQISPTKTPEENKTEFIYNLFSDFFFTHFVPCVSICVSIFGSIIRQIDLKIGDLNIKEIECETNVSVIDPQQQLHHLEMVQTNNQTNNQCLSIFLK